MMVNRLAQFGHMSADRRLAGFDTRFETMQASLAIFPRVGFPRWVLSEAHVGFQGRNWPNLA